MTRKIGKNHYIASPLRGSGDDSPIPIPVHVTRSSAYSDGEDSHRALSERTLSEYTSVPYTIVNERDRNGKLTPYRTSPQHNGGPYKTSPTNRAPSALSRGSRYEDNRGRYDDNRVDNRGRYDDNRVDNRGRYDDNRAENKERYDDNRGGRFDDNGSDIYVTSGAYRGYNTNKAPSEVSRSSKPRAPSRYSYRSGVAPSIASRASRTSTVKTGKSSRKGGVTVETMAAPNPFCPNIKGMCCLMLLLNLGIILVTLGFVIVIQFFEPLLVWILGIVFLIFGFLTLIGSLIYCVTICRDVKSPKDVNPDELYWTHYWSKTIGSSPSDIHYKSETEKYLDDKQSDRYSVGKMSKYSDKGRYSDREKERNRY